LTALRPPTKQRAVKITVHIGLEKTGTTTIQGFLSRKRDALLDQGILFPVAPGKSNQTLLAAAAMAGDVNIRARALKTLGPDFAADLARQLEAEIAEAQPQRLLFSNEHCSSRLHTVEEVQRLRDFLAQFGDEMVILVYLRRQDEFLLSTYSTSVKSGSVKPFVIPRGRKLHARYDYRVLLELWGGVFGQAAMRPRLFQPSSWVGGDLLTDFCDAAELDVSEREAPTRNLSLSAEGLELVRMLNKQSGGERDGSVVRAVGKLTAGPKLSLSTATRREFMRHFEDSNHWVAETFFGREQLFDDVREGMPETLLPEISEDHFAELREAIEAETGEKAADRRARERAE
jgi:hypothetical protein